MRDANMSDGMVRLTNLIQQIHQIDLMLRQANCILMFCQPLKPGKITIRFPEGMPASGFGIASAP